MIISGFRRLNPRCVEYDNANHHHTVGGLATQGRNIASRHTEALQPLYHQHHQSTTTTTTKHHCYTLWTHRWSRAGLVYVKSYIVFDKFSLILLPNLFFLYNTV